MAKASDPQTDRELLLNINDHVTQLRDDVKEIKGKMDNKPNIDYCKDQHVFITKRLDSQGARIGSLENWRWYIMGGVAVAIVIIESLVQILR